MAGKIKQREAPRRDRADRAMLRHMGDPAHINGEEARLLARTMPEAHGKVVTKGLLAEAGRRGDDRVTLLTPEERALLKARGGAGTRNPESGLLEFWGENDGEGDQGPGGSSGPGGQGVGPTGHGADSPAGPGNSDGADRNDFGLGYRNYDPTTMPSIESLLNTPSGYRAPGYEGLSMTQYSPPDTFGRLLDVFRYGPPPSYKALGAVPGRYGAPTGRGPGVMGTMAGFLTGNPMSMAMGLGTKFDQAMSPATRAASLAENQATGARNSTGQDRDSSTGLSLGDLAANVPGAASGAQTAELTMNGHPVSSVPAGYTVNAAGQVIPDSSSDGRTTLTGLPRPIENLLGDYIWRGRQGSGWGW